MLHTENNCQKPRKASGFGADRGVGGELARMLGCQIDERFGQIGVFAGADSEH